MSIEKSGQVSERSQVEVLNDLVRQSHPQAELLRDVVANFGFVPPLGLDKQQRRIRLDVLEVLVVLRDEDFGVLEVDDLDLETFVCEDGLDCPAIEEHDLLDFPLVTFFWFSIVIKLNLI